MASLHTAPALRHALAHAQLRAAPSCAARAALASTGTSSVTAAADLSRQYRTSSSPLPPAAAAATSLRAIHTTAALRKGNKGKGGKGKGKDKGDSSPGTPESSASSPSSPSDSKHPTPTPENLLDFADVRSRLAGPEAHMGDALRKLHSGGRFNPDAIGALRVSVKDPSSSGSGSGGPKAATYPLRELAAVVPRGGAGSRAVSILCHEEASVKAIMSAVQASPDFNQQPQRSTGPDANPLELTLKVEAESREDLARRVKATCNEWRDRIRAIRHQRLKLHDGWAKNGEIVPDAKQIANKELERVIKAAMTDVDAKEKESLKLVAK